MQLTRDDERWLRALKVAVDDEPRPTQFRAPRPAWKAESGTADREQAERVVFWGNRAKLYRSHAARWRSLAYRFRRRYQIAVAVAATAVAGLVILAIERG